MINDMKTKQGEKVADFLNVNPIQKAKNTKVTQLNYLYSVLEYILYWWLIIWIFGYPEWALSWWIQIIEFLTVKIFYWLTHCDKVYL